MPSILARDMFTRHTAAVSIQAGRAEIRAASGTPDEGVYLSPGWVDIQVNGFAGYDVNGPDTYGGSQAVDRLRAITCRLAEEGVSTWFPTVITGPDAQIESCLRAIAQACEADAVTRKAVAGIHLEGPYISPEDGPRGAHPAEYVRLPDWEEFQRWQEMCGGRIRIVTLAPELPGAVALVRRLAGSGVLAALGHTTAAPEAIAAAVDAGARLSTHLGNGIAARIDRHANPIWSQLADDRLWTSLILDGFHLPEAVTRVFIKAKGVRKIVLISDATALARMAPGIYQTPVGGTVELHPNGRLALYGTPYLAGSAASLKDGIENAVRIAGCTLADAVRMASLNPARLLHLRTDARTLFHWDSARQSITVLATIQSGETRFCHPSLC